MPETITLTIPDDVLRPIERIAIATHSAVDDVLLTALKASLPPLEGLPSDVIENLTVLETHDDQTLCQVMRETVPADDQEHLRALLEKNRSNSLTEVERERLASLQKSADLVMLRRARAAVLLRFRGKRIPTLAELNQAAS